MAAKKVKADRTTELPAIPPRPSDAHKGAFGRVLIVAGSEGMSGAAILAGKAALHGGAGLVTLAVPRCILGIVASAHPSYMTVALAHDGRGRLDAAALETLGDAMAGKTAIALGPGLGQSRGVSAVVHELYEHCPRPLVLDADGLNAFSEDAPLDGAVQGPRILTPHPGEFARLTGMDIPAIQADRVRVAVEFAQHHGIVLLLKGEKTVITDGQRYALNETGNVALATGGTGDILTGVITALLAQGMDSFSAAQLGAHLHGLAADCAAEELSPEFMTSADLLRYLNAAWLQLPGANG